MAGLFLAFVQLGSVEALWTAAYGQVFLIKLAAAANFLGRHIDGPSIGYLVQHFRSRNLIVSNPVQF